MSICTAHNRQGQPCGRHAMTGTHVCDMHGGKLPQVQNKIRERILAAADPALGEMIRLARKARNEAVRRQAAADLLDRAGYKPSDKVEHTGANGGPQEIAVVLVKAIKPE